jgi:NADPH2:quinone reductase
MKAVILDAFGGPEVFRVAEIPTPALKPGHVLIRVAATSVNPIDARIRAGRQPEIAPDLPAVLHGDVAGTVEAAGEGVTRLKPGDAVWALAGGVKGLGGALAEYLLADADLVALKPASLGFVEAAALPLAGTAAWEAVVERAAVRPGQRVLVIGAAGGVGHVALQLAVASGAFVTAADCGEAKAALARTLGAEATIDVRSEPIARGADRPAWGEGFDVVVDAAGGGALSAAFQAVRIGGMVVTVAARSTQDLTPLHVRGATLHAVFVLLPLLTGVGRARHGEILRRLGEWADAGRVRPLVDPEPFAFRDAGAAHRKLEAGRARGKIVLTAGW